MKWWIYILILIAIITAIIMLNKNNFIRWNDPSSSDLELIGNFADYYNGDIFHSHISISPKWDVSTSVLDYVDYDNSNAIGGYNEFVGFIYKATSAMKFHVENYNSLGNGVRIRIYGRNKIMHQYVNLFESDATPSPYIDEIISISIDTSTYDLVKVGAFNPVGWISYIAGYLYVKRSDELLSSLYYPKLIKNEEVSIYVNFANPISSTFGNLAIGLSKDNELLYYDIATLEQSVMPDSTYRLHFKFDFFNMKLGCYQFVIYDEANYDDWLYVSNIVEYAPKVTSYIRQVKFKNDFNDILGYEFDDIGEYYSIGLDLFIGMEQFKEKATAYKLYDGKTKRVRSSTKKIYTCQARYFDEYALNALQAMLLMDDIIIYGTGANEDSEINLYAEQGAKIVPSWTEKEQLTALAEFELIDKDFKYEL